MSNLYLFRLKAVGAPQGTLFGASGSREQFLYDLIASKPSAELREGYMWHIGNVRAINNDGLLFAAGRTTRTSKEFYDEETGNFLEIEEDESPFTFVYYEPRFSILAIAPKSRLSPTVKGIARSLEKLVNVQPATHDQGIRIEISEIWDPEDFINQVQSAYAVVGFTIAFSEPNPFDVEADFHRPMERYLEATGGTKGKATVQGEDLDKDSIEKVTRSVASTGNDASARLRKRRGQRPVTKHLRGDPVSIIMEDEDAEDNAGFLDKIRHAYQQVRNRGGE